MNEDIIFKYFPELDGIQRERMTMLGPLYREWNSRINVISRKDMDNLYVHHVLHSLALVRFIKDHGLRPESIFDAGTGGGFPGRRRYRRRFSGHTDGCRHAGMPVHPL